MIEHKSATDWFDEMKRTYPDIEVFTFDMDDKVSRALSTADKESEGLRQVVEVVTPYDVIDRLGRHESATQAEHDSDRPSPSQHGSKGSAERRKRRRQLAAAAATAAADAVAASAAASAVSSVAVAAPAAGAAPSTARAQATRAPASVRPRSGPARNRNLFGDD